MKTLNWIAFMALICAKAFGRKPQDVAVRRRRPRQARRIMPVLGLQYAEWRPEVRAPSALETAEILRR